MLNLSIRAVGMEFQGREESKNTGMPTAQEDGVDVGSSF